MNASPHYTLADLRSAAARLAGKIDRRGAFDCWPWLAGKQNGYGRLAIAGKARRAHRLAWELVNETILPPDMMACHACDNPACCNPRHIFAGDHIANMRDAWSKGRQANQKKLVCHRGHRLSGPNLYRKKNGHRTCLTCVAISRGRSIPAHLEAA